MKLETRKNALKVLAAILCAGGLLALSACNTVRGIGKDISSAADTLDPNSN
ncbi:MAG: entericidin A/B family lipoprotein [Phycisphaerales bacterium]